MKTSFDNAYQGSSPDPESVGVDGDKKGGTQKPATSLSKISVPASSSLFSVTNSGILRC